MDCSSHAARDSSLTRLLLVRLQPRVALLGRGRFYGHARKEEQRRAGQQHLAVPQCGFAAATAAAAAAADAATDSRSHGGLENQRGGETLVSAMPSPRVLGRAKQAVQRRRFGGFGGAARALRRPAKDKWGLRSRTLRRRRIGRGSSRRAERPVPGGVPGGEAAAEAASRRR